MSHAIKNKLGGWFSQYRNLPREIYVLFGCELIDNAGSLIGPLLTLILSAKLGMNAQTIAIIFLVETGLSIPIRLLGGKLADKVNKRVFINVCDILTTILYLSCGIFGFNHITHWVYMAGSLLQAAESPAYKSLIADYTLPKDRDRAYSLSYLGMNLGMVLAPTIGSLLMKDHLELMFYINGSMELISVILFNLFLRKTRAIENTDNRYEKRTEHTSLLSVIKKNKVATAYLFLLAVEMVFYEMEGFLLPLSMQSVHGEEAGTLLFGTVSSVNCVTVLLATALLTAAFKRRGTVGRMIFGMLFEIAGLGICLLGFLLPVFYYVGIVIFTFGEILNTISSMPHLTCRIPQNFRAEMIAFSQVLCVVFQAAGRYGIGYVYDSGDSVLSWLFVFAIGILSVGGFLLLLPADRRAYPELYREAEE